MEIWEEEKKGRETGRLRKSERLKLMMGCVVEKEGRKEEKEVEEKTEREREVAVG